MNADDPIQAEVSSKVRSMFARIKKMPSDEVMMDADLFEVYRLDSLYAVKLLSALEVEYDVIFPEHEVSREKLKTLNDVSATVSRLVRQKV